jgi:putative tricarboxylic transport membrane protein
MTAGVFLAVLGLVAAWASTGIDEGAGGQLHPRTFPILIGVLLFIGGTLLSARAATSGNGAEKAIAWPDRRGWKYWVVSMASLVLYVGLSQPLGFLISTFIFVPWFIWYFGRYRPLVTVSCALGVVAFIYLVFIRLLELTLPLGPLSFLG